jgi:hypothetical protein
VSTNYLNRKIGDDRFNGMKVFKCLLDGQGQPFQAGGRYVVFDNGTLVSEAASLTEAERDFLVGKRTEGPRLEEYKGIDRRLR